MVAGLGDELSLEVMDYVDGASALRAAAASPVWARLLLGAKSEDYWRRTTIRELDAPALQECGPPLCCAAPWRARFRELKQRCPRRARWLSWSTRHGLTDRVAAPQLFVGPRGRRLFCYGGWTRLGPQTDVQWTNLSEIAKLARRGRGRSSEAGVQHVTGPLFRRAEDTGRPVQRGGVQTLTPLWRTNGGLEGPSRSHVAAALGVPLAELESDVELVLTFGGAGGGYNNEHNDWRIAALKEGRDEEPARLAWTGVGRSRRDGGTHDQAEIDTRCAHSATYVPPRLLDGHTEGAVFVIGGHTDDCTRSLAAVDCLDVAQWTWERHIGEGCSFAGRHGHSATLVEVNGAGYIIVVGGGTGNILHGFGAGIAEFDDCCVFDCRAKHWLATFDLGARQSVGTCFGRHHTSAACCNGRTLLFGGGASPTNRLGLLDMRRCVKRALSSGPDRPACRRRVAEPLLCDLTPGLVESDVPTAPRGRKMHGAACLLPWLPLFVVFGGWEFGPHFSDMWLADLEPAGGPSIVDIEEEDKAPDDSDDDDGSLDGQFYENCEDAARFGRDDDDEYGSNEEFEQDENPGDDEDLVALNLATDTGMHQIQIPRSVFHRLVRQGMLGFAPNNPNQHVLDANGSSGSS